MSNNTDKTTLNNRVTLEYIGAFLGFVGTVCVLFGHTLDAWYLWMMSSAFLVRWSWHNKHYGILMLNFAYGIVDIVGVSGLIH